MIVLHSWSYKCSIQIEGFSQNLERESKIFVLEFGSEDWKMEKNRKFIFEEILPFKKINYFRRVIYFSKIRDTFS